MTKFLFLLTILLLTQPALTSEINDKEKISENENKIENKINEINVEKKEIKPFFAKDRLKFIQHLFAENNDLTMTTPLGDILYKTLYLKDLAFIRQEIENTTESGWMARNKKWVLRELNDLDTFVKKYMADDMSLADYALIGYFWAEILSGGTLTEHDLFWKKPLNEQSEFQQKHGYPMRAIS